MHAATSFLPNFCMFGSTSYEDSLCVRYMDMHSSKTRRLRLPRPSAPEWVKRALDTGLQTQAPGTPAACFPSCVHGLDALAQPRSRDASGIQHTHGAHAWSEPPAPWVGAQAVAVLGEMDTGSGSALFSIRVYWSIEHPGKAATAQKLYVAAWPCPPSLLLLLPYHVMMPPLPAGVLHLAAGHLASAGDRQNTQPQHQPSPAACKDSAQAGSPQENWAWQALHVAPRFESIFEAPDASDAASDSGLDEAPYTHAAQQPHMRSELTGNPDAPVFKSAMLNCHPSGEPPPACQGVEREGRARGRDCLVALFELCASKSGFLEPCLRTYSFLLAFLADLSGPKLELHPS